MTQFTVRNLEEDVRDKLRELAKQQGQSFEETVRQVLRAAVLGVEAEPAPLGSRIADRFRREGLDQPIEELRGQQLDPPDLGG